MAPAARAGKLTTLYSFEHKPDGAYPYAPLLYVGGALWGVTSELGSGPYVLDGTVFAIPLDGAPAVILPFTGGGTSHPNKRPWSPTAGLVQIGEYLFGATNKGGDYDTGVVFVVMPSGEKRSIYSFQGFPDAGPPSGKLIAVGGTLYGVSGTGGAYDYGTIFKVTPQGDESVLHSFNPKGAVVDCGYPSASLLYSDGVFYGTAAGGGAHGLGCVFSITPEGQFTVMHSFAGKSDGLNPQSSLIRLGGKFYGTTTGGKNARNNVKAGTVFSLTKAGHITTLHTFSDAGGDGNLPIGGLVKMGGLLYGVTRYGGGSEERGTIYSITPTGIETPLHSFASKPKGYYPEGPLIAVGDTLYGTTQNGGVGGGADGFGTVFGYTP